MAKPLFKTTVVIWTEYDPQVAEVELEDLAREATEGDAYASSQTTVAVAADALDADADATEGMREFFADLHGDDEGQD